jgi:probable rRNA maturation factor
VLVDPLAHPRGQRTHEAQLTLRQTLRTARGRPTVATMRSIYVPPWRIDLTHRPGTPSILAAPELARAIARALTVAGAPGPGSVGLTLTNDVELAELNERHMAVRGPTDVLSFPILAPSAFPPHPGKAKDETAQAPVFPTPPGYRQPIGDIVVSVERAIAQATDGRGGQTGDVRWSAADELRLLVTHGALHLCGWDHADPTEEAAMRALEATLLAGGEAKK